jgi:hypothetical protein
MRSAVLGLATLVLFASLAGCSQYQGPGDYQGATTPYQPRADRPTPSPAPAAPTVSPTTTPTASPAAPLPANGTPFAGPGFQLGNHWVYDQEIGNSKLQHNVSIAAIESHVAGNGRAYQSYRFEDRAEGLDATTWIATSNLGVVEYRVHFENDAGSYNSTLVFDLPCRNAQYPMSQGQTWTIACHGTVQVIFGAQPLPSQPVYVNGTGKAVGYQTATSPAGSFAAFRYELNTTTESPGSPPSTTEAAFVVSSQACNDVLREVDGEPSMALIEYHCDVPGSARSA